MTFILLDESRPGQVIDRQPQGTATQEHPLRDLIFEHPELLPVRELEPEIGRVVAVRRASPSISVSLRWPNIASSIL
jgi:hypothetical protein